MFNCQFKVRYEYFNNDFKEYLEKQSNKSSLENSFTAFNNYILHPFIDNKEIAIINTNSNSIYPLLVNLAIQNIKLNVDSAQVLILTNDNNKLTLIKTFEIFKTKYETICDKLGNMTNSSQILILTTNELLDYYNKIDKNEKKSDIMKNINKIIFDNIDLFEILNEKIQLITNNVTYKLYLFNDINIDCWNLICSNLTNIYKVYMYKNIVINFSPVKHYYMKFESKNKMVGKINEIENKFACYSNFFIVYVGSDSEAKFYKNCPKLVGNESSVVFSSSTDEENLKEIDKFKDRTYDCLIATDKLIEYIEDPKINRSGLVINMNLPKDLNNYIFRSGSYGCEAERVCVNLITDDELPNIEILEKFYNIQIKHLSHDFSEYDNECLKFEM